MELQIDDSALVRDYISGDERALEILIHRHNQRISSFIYSKVLDRDVTEDIFQDTFIKVIKTLKKGNYSEEGKFLPWVMRIAHNLIGAPGAMGGAVSADPERVRAKLERTLKRPGMLRSVARGQRVTALNV